MQHCDFLGTPSPRKDSSPGRIGGSTLGPHQGPSRTSQEADSWLGTDSCAPRNASFERIIYKCLSWDRLAAARTFQPVAPRPRPSSHRAEFSLFAPDSWAWAQPHLLAHCPWLSGTPREAVSLWVLALIYFQRVPSQLVAVRTLSPLSSVGTNRPGSPIPGTSSPFLLTRLCDTSAAAHCQ